MFCNGAETCSAAAGYTCVSGPDPCAYQLCDGVGEVCVDCFDDIVCIALLLTWTNAGDDGLHEQDCDDGEFCTGPEMCNGTVCVLSDDPCLPLGLLCNEMLDSCVYCLADAVRITALS